jgi:RecA-family ATPase
LELIKNKTESGFCSPTAVEESLKKILVMDIASLDELLVSISRHVTSYSPRVVIIDSLAALVHSHLGAKMATLTRLQTLGGSLRRLAAEHHLTVLLVNHQLEGGEEEGGAPRAAMGTTWQMVADVKVCFAKKRDIWTTTLVKSSKFKEATVNVELKDC